MEVKCLVSAAERGPFIDVPTLVGVGLKFDNMANVSAMSSLGY
jgi:hypothetical protein